MSAWVFLKSPRSTESSSRPNQGRTQIHIQIPTQTLPTSSSLSQSETRTHWRSRPRVTNLLNPDLDPHCPTSSSLHIRSLCHPLCKSLCKSSHQVQVSQPIQITLSKTKIVAKIVSSHSSDHPKFCESHRNQFISLCRIPKSLVK